MRDIEQDDIDRLFARLEQVELPPDFAARLMARIDSGALVLNRQPLWRRGLVYGGVYVVALVALAVLAYSVGVSMVHSGTSTLIAELIHHVEVFTYAPDAYLKAIVDSVPWLQIAGLGLDLIVLAVVTRLLLRGARVLRQPAAG